MLSDGRNCPGLSRVTAQSVFYWQGRVTACQLLLFVLRITPYTLSLNSFARRDIDALLCSNKLSKITIWLVLWTQLSSFGCDYSSSPS